jgi:Na+-transporting NADH:ubiquinone oxidoreductase subunit F
MVVQVPDEVFGVKRYECTVVSNRNVSSFIKEFVVALPEGEELEFRAGGYIQIECPPHNIKYTDFDIDERFRDEWDRYNLCVEVRVAREEAGNACVFDGQFPA